jgi:Dolichyl-phosphate-mannose-protein mannosyltransferase
MVVKISRAFARWLPLVVVLCLGTSLRAEWIREVQPSPTHDAKWYVGRAKGFAKGQGISLADRPTAYRPVGYPAVLGATYKVFAVRPSAHRFLNLGLSVLTLTCLYLATLAITHSKIAAVCSAVLFACYPTDVAYTSLAVSEPLFNACMLAGVAAWFAKRRAVISLLLCSVCLFGAAMTRGAGFILPLVLACFRSVPGLRLRPRLTRAALLLALVGLLFVPWWLRNLSAFGGFVPVANNGGVNLYIGNNPLATGAYRFDRAVVAQLPAGLDQSWLGSGGPKEYEIDRALAALARQYMVENPVKTLQSVPRKLKFLFVSDQAAFEWNRSRDLRPSALFACAYSFGPYYYVVLWLLAAGATALFVQRGRTRIQRCLISACLVAVLWLAALDIRISAVLVGVVLFGAFVRTHQCVRTPQLAYAAVASFSAFQLVYFGDARFHHAMMPWVCMMAGAGIAAIKT